MLNKEKFEKEIIEIACAGNSISMVGGELCGCIGNYCVRCDFSKKYGAEGCEKAIQEWANSEYVEEIDWSKVEDGTLIWVKQEVAKAMTEGIKIGRANTIAEVITNINELTTYYAGDKEGNPLTPKMIIKSEVDSILQQLKENNNGN